MADVLRLVLPKGSLERATLELFEAADLAVTRSSTVDYKADDRRPPGQRGPHPAAPGDPGLRGGGAVRPGHHRPGLGGGDRQPRGQPRRAALLQGDRQPGAGRGGGRPRTRRPRRWTTCPRACGCRPSTPQLTARFFADRGIEADVRLSYGASEAKIPDIADCIVDITETGRALRAAGLRIIDTILVSYTEVVANAESYADPAKRHAMGQLMTLLTGTLEARDKVLVKLNVSRADFDRVLPLVPALKAPTVSELAGDGGYAIETVVPKNQINILIPALKDAGATGILELPISKIVH